MMRRYKRSVLPFAVFTHWMVPRGNSSSTVLPVLWSSAGAKKRDRICASVCVCICVYVRGHVVPVLCWWFTQLSGSNPRPIFSFSLHNCKRYHWSHVSCPFSSTSSSSCSSATSCSSFPHPPPSCMCGSFKGLFCCLDRVVTSSRTTPKAQSGRPDSRVWHGEVRRMGGCFWLKCHLELPKSPGSGIRYTICLQNSTQLGSRVWRAENRDSQSQSSLYWPTYGHSAPTEQSDEVEEKGTRGGGEQRGVENRKSRRWMVRSWREFVGRNEGEEWGSLCVQSVSVCRRHV